jgi:hypothetical protein
MAPAVVIQTPSRRDAMCWNNEDELYKGMCDVIVDVGGYCLADVAVPNNDEGKTVRFLATAGRDDGYFAGASISWGDGPLSKGPTGAARVPREAICKNGWPRTLLTFPPCLRDKEDIQFFVSLITTRADSN